jgi:serine/threonine protein kinase
VVRNGVYSEPQAARVMYQLMDAVAYMHSRHISHRDIKVMPRDRVIFMVTA